ncbi:MAG: fumarylacetoacetate hydrolase family protein [Bacteroidota bacterium]
MTTKTNIAEQAAAKIREAISSGKTINPLRDVIGTDDLDLAYEIQRINHQPRLAAGARSVGCKIGLTSEAVQAQLGVDQPDYGVLFDDMEVLHGAVVPWSELMQPKAEAEVAFVLKQDLPDTSITTAELISAVDYALASIEIVGSRIENWNIKITDTIADNASASHFVLGHRPVKLEAIDLINCGVKVYKNGELASEGKGAACLGSPITALMWLAKTMARLGNPLKAGDIVLSGALGPMVPVEPGDEVKAVFDTLGEVRVRFGKG